MLSQTMKRTTTIKAEYKCRRAMKLSQMRMMMKRLRSMKKKSQTLFVAASNQRARSIVKRASQMCKKKVIIAR